MSRKFGLIKFVKIAKESSNLSDEKFLDYIVEKNEVKIGERDSEENSNIVSSIQDRLQTLGYTMSAGVDGVYGKQTEEAVKKFQNLNRLQETGKVDSQTYLSLTDPSANKNSEQEKSPLDSSELGKSTSSGEPGSFKSDFGGGIQSISEGEVSPVKLFMDVYERMGNANLAVAIVANAHGESGLRYSVAGDCGSYAESKIESINISGKGKCCSFGLWQMNICGGLGSQFLKQNGSPKDPEEKIKVLTDYNKQVDFMCSYVKSKYSNVVSKKDTVENFVEWFVNNVERPAMSIRGKAISGRSSFAESLMKDPAVKEKIDEQNKDSTEVVASERFNKLIKFSRLFR
jgi:hypothetical protein